MYKLDIVLNGNFNTLQFNTFDEVEEYIDKHWNNNADYWVSYNNNPAVEYRDLFRG